MIKQRNIALCIVFSIITFGIYALYWFVCLTNDANQESGQTDATSGGVASMDGSGHIRWARKLIS